MTIYRPGQHIYYPGSGVRVVQPGGAAAIPWYLSGGIAAENCIAAYTPKGAASLAASYDNNAAPGNGLADGTYDAAPGTAPTWDAATGWYGKSSAYLTTGIVPASGWSGIARFNGLNVGDNDQGAFGSYASATTAFAVEMRRLVSDEHRYWNGGAVSVASRLAAGVMAIAGSSGYLNGIEETSAIPAWSGTGRAIYLLAINNGGANPWNIMTGYLYAVAIYNTTLSAAQVAAVSAAMAAL